MHDFNPADVRFIKLGPGNAWWDHARANNLLELGHKDLSHEIALTGDFETIKRGVAAYKPGKATTFATEIDAFYGLPAGSLWITFANKRMWWATAGDAISWIGETPDHGARTRTLQTPWRSTDMNGEELWIEQLPGGLARTAGYRMSVCKVAAAEKAIDRILCRESDVARRARAAKTTMVSAAEAMIADLSARDFELLIGLIFSAAGWKRIGELGGVQRDTDMVLQQSITRESAFVQVKAMADPQTFKASVEAFEKSGLDRMFFACHSPSGDWGETPDDVFVLSGPALAERAIETGQFDWLLAKTR